MHGQAVTVYSSMSVSTREVGDVGELDRIRPLTPILPEWQGLR